LIASENTNNSKRESYKIDHEKKTFQGKRKMEMVLWWRFDRFLYFMRKIQKKLCIMQGNLVKQYIIQICVLAVQSILC